MNRPVFSILVLAVCLRAGTAQAEAPGEEATTSEVEASISTPALNLQPLDRPTGIAEAGIGMLTLPGAEVCVERSLAGCTQGDTSFSLEGWQLFRGHRRFSFGAGIVLALISTTDAPRQDPSGIEREHRRSYLTAEGVIRYYFYLGERVEWWLGLTGGLVVVSDRFEGGIIGLAIGPSITLSEHWSLGGSLRYGHWFLPSEPAVDPLGTEASLTGRNTVLGAGVNVAFRTAL
jgi:hypothetical protein